MLINVPMIVAAARRPRPLGKRRCHQNSAALRSCLNGVCLSINHKWCSPGWYVMRGTDELWPLGKVLTRKGANKKVPLVPGWEETSELVNDSCLHCLFL